MTRGRGIRRKRKRRRMRTRKVGHARWRSSRSHSKKSWTKVRLMVEKCKLSGNPRREGTDEGARRGHAVLLLWVDNGVSPAYQPAKTP